MMGTKERSFAPLIHVSLEELVPQDHCYRRLERTLDLSFVREFVQNTYAGGGRSSIDPVVFFKLQLVIFLEGIRSECLLMGDTAVRRRDFPSSDWPIRQRSEMIPRCLPQARRDRCSVLYVSS